MHILHGPRIDLIDRHLPPGLRDAGQQFHAGGPDGYRDLGADRMVVSVIAQDRDQLLRGLDRVVA